MNVWLVGAFGCASAYYMQIIITAYHWRLQGFGSRGESMGNGSEGAPAGGWIFGKFPKFTKFYLNFKN